MPDTALWCATCEVPHPPGEWQQDCQPAGDTTVAQLADVISQAHAAGIRAGAWSLARWVLERWPARIERATIPDTIRTGTTTSRRAVEDIMALVDTLNPPPELRAQIRTKISFAYAAGLVGGRAARQPEIDALQAALTRRRRPGEEPA